MPLILMTFTLVVMTTSGIWATPRGVRLTWSDDPTATIAISWTSDLATDSEVIYGTSPNALDHTVSAQQQFSQLPPLNNSFTAELSGLLPATVYYYRVGSPGNYHPIPGNGPFSFKTMNDDPCQPFTYVLLGDTENEVDGIGPSSLWSGILSEAMAHSPDFFVFAGDMVKNGDEPIEWSNFIDNSEPGLAYIPIVLTIGEHDDMADNGPTSYYSQLFELPRNPQNGWENYYGIDVGPIHFFSLDSNAHDAPFTAMISWLDADLAASSRIWLMGLLHHGIYSRGAHYTGEEDNGYLNAGLIPVFDSRNVDFVLNGHSHTYERYAPTLGVDIAFGGTGRSFPNGGGLVNGPGSTLPDGTVATTYLVSGGAGALTEQIPGFTCIDAGCTWCTGINLNCDPNVLALDQEGNAAYVGKHHFCVFDVDGDEIQAEVWTTDTGNPGQAEMVDSFTMINLEPCVSPMPEADLDVNVTDGSCFVLPGGSVTYTVTVNNDGPSDAPSASVSDSVLADLTITSWTCAASGSAACGSPSGSGPLSDSPSLTSGDGVTYTVSGTVSGSAFGWLTYTVTASPGAGVTDPNVENNSDGDQNALELPVFCEGFEDGTTNAWSQVLP